MILTFVSHEFVRRQVLHEARLRVHWHIVSRKFVIYDNMILSIGSHDLVMLAFVSQEFSILAFVSHEIVIFAFMSLDMLCVAFVSPRLMILACVRHDFVTLTFASRGIRELRQRGCGNCEPRS